MKTKLILPLTLLVAWATFGTTDKLLAADPLPGSHVPEHLWYVKRAATHSGSGLSYTQEYGPYQTVKQAELKKTELDQTRTSGNYAFGPSELVSKPNPLLLHVQSGSIRNTAVVSELP